MHRIKEKLTFTLVYDDRWKPLYALSPSGERISYRKYREYKIAEKYPKLAERGEATPEGLSLFRKKTQRKNQEKLEAASNYQANTSKILKSWEGKTKRQRQNLIKKIQNPFDRAQAEKWEEEVEARSAELEDEENYSASAANFRAIQELEEEWFEVPSSTVFSNENFKEAYQTLKNEEHSGSEMTKKRFEALQLLGFINEEYDWQEWKFLYLDE